MDEDLVGILLALTFILVHIHTSTCRELFTLIFSNMQRLVHFLWGWIPKLNYDVCTLVSLTFVYHRKARLDVLYTVQYIVKVRLNSRLRYAYICTFYNRLGCTFVYVVTFLWVRIWKYLGQICREISPLLLILTRG